MTVDRWVQDIASLALQRGLSVAVAESLTCGRIASALGRGNDASEWFAGGVVAYLSRVKTDVLGVPAGPVVTPPTAEHMARGVHSS